MSLTLLTERYKKHVKRFHEKIDPTLSWTKRGIHIKHGKRTAMCEGYDTFLSHDPKKDMEEALKKPTRREERTELRKGTATEVPGGRWITVHPNGPEEDGHPVYIVPNPDGSYSITRGAGGKLNGMRLHNIKSEDEYRQMGKERKAQKELTLKMNEERLKAKMGDEAYAEHVTSKQIAEKSAVVAKVTAEKEFIGAVAKMQGVDPQMFEVPKELLKTLSPRAAARVQTKAHKAALSYAKQVSDKVQTAVLNAYEDISKDTLGDIGINDLAKNSPGDGGKGYQAQMGRMAAENGLTDASARKMARETSYRGFLERSDGDVDAALKKQSDVMRLQAGAASARAEDKTSADAMNESHGAGPIAAKALPIVPNIENMADAVEILRAAHKMKQTTRDAEDFKKEIREAEDATKLPTFAPPIISKNMSDEAATAAAADSLSQESMQKSMQRLITTTNDMEAEGQTLGAHYSVGQNVAFNTLAQAVDGATVDPVVMDTLGPGATARVLAAHWRSQMEPDEFERVAKVLADDHIGKQQAIADKGVAIAQGFLDDAAAIASDVVPETPEELEAVLTDHARRVELLRCAREASGVARGRLEAAASLNEAMMHKAGDVHVNLGKIASKDALGKIYAIGLNDPSEYDNQGKMLKEGDFTLHSDGENRILQIHASGVGKLAPKGDPDIQKRAAITAAIKNGDHDEPDWLPTGISRRPTSSFEIDPLQMHSIDHQIKLTDSDSPDKYAQELKNFIGARISEGVDTKTIAADVTNEGFIADLGLGEEGSSKYTAALESVVPNFFQSVRAQIDAGIPKSIDRGSDEYKAAYEAERVNHAQKLNTRSDEYQHAFAAHHETLRKKLESYADDFVDSQKENGVLSADEASIDKQRIPLDEVTQDCLYQAALKDPRTHNALLGLSEVNSAAIRSYALEKILKVDPKSQDIISKISPEQKNVYHAWEALKQKSGAEHVYKSIQEDMLKRHAQNDVEDIFGDKPDTAPPALAKVDISSNEDVLATARANAGALGYKLQVNPDTGKMEYRDLFPGEVYGEKDQTVKKLSDRTEETITRDARSRIKAKLREHFIGTMTGSGAVADTGWNPESVITSSSRWSKYVEHVGGIKKATQTVQDVMAGELHANFAALYQGRTGKKLSSAMVPIRNDQFHSEALLDPDKVEAIAQRRRAESANVGRGQKGRFVTGSRKEAVAAAEAIHDEGTKLFGETEKGATNVATKRVTLGKSIEGALRGIAPFLGVDKPTEAAQDISMSGKAAPRQRACKIWEETKRVGLALQAGGGKTSVGLGTFTSLRSQGKVKRAIYVVPSNLVGQFGSEFAKFADPSKGLRWHADTGASASERRAAMSDQNTHAVVMTPESLREDVTGAVAEDLGVTKESAVRKLAGMSHEETDKHIHAAMDKRGWNFEFSMFDEGHRLLGRQGKPDSHMARVADSVGRKAEYMGASSADPVKNDPSEAFDYLHKIAPDKYGDHNKDSFLRKYSRNTVASALALRREMEPFMYASSVDIGVESNRHVHALDLTPEQRTEYADIARSSRRVKIARQQGNLPAMVDAMKKLSPKSFGKTDEPDEEVAQRLSSALGTITETAYNRAVNTHPTGAKMNWLFGGGEHASGYLNDHKGEPTVVFAHNLDAVHAIVKAAKEKGHRVAKITGDMSPDAKDKARIAFAPGGGEASADLLVCSDASAMGANLQRGYHLINYDTPQTATLHAQRIAREVRQGQKNIVSVHDLVGDCAFERRNRKRLARKHDLREALTSNTESMDDSGLLRQIQQARVRKFDNDSAKGKTTSE